MDLAFKMQPNETVDLHFALATDGTTANQNRFVRAFVTDPLGVNVTGSPFTLTHEARGRYVDRSAFKLGKEGTFSIEYIPYSDAGFANEDLDFERGLWIIYSKYEDIGGLGGVDEDGLAKFIQSLFEDLPRQVWRFDTSKIKNDQTAIRQILNALNISVPEVDLDRVIQEIKNVPDKIAIPDLNSVNSNIGRVLLEVQKYTVMTELIQNLHQELKGLTKGKSDLEKGQLNGFKDLNKILGMIQKDGSLKKAELEGSLMAFKGVFNKRDKKIDKVFSLLGKILEIGKQNHSSSKSLIEWQTDGFGKLDSLIKANDKSQITRLTFTHNKLVDALRKVFKPNIKINLNDNKKIKK